MFISSRDYNKKQYKVHVREFADKNLIPAIYPLCLSHKLVCIKFRESFIDFKRVSRRSCEA